MTFKDINIRDPFILPYDGKYYLYGTRGKTAWVAAEGLDVYVSNDLETWSEPHECFHFQAQSHNYLISFLNNCPGRWVRLVSFSSIV